MTRRYLLYTLAAAALIVIIVLVDKAEDLLTRIEYPMDVWRMDLDDIAANVGFFLAGLAAFLTVWKKAGKAHDRADQVSQDINGGLASLASQIVADELRQSDIEVGLHNRVTALEDLLVDYQGCLDREKVWDAEKEQLRIDRTALRDWLNRRLDESGHGRDTPR